MMNLFGYKHFFLEEVSWQNFLLLDVMLSAVPAAFGAVYIKRYISGRSRKDLWKGAALLFIPTLLLILLYHAYFLIAWEPPLIDPLLWLQHGKK